MHRSSDARGNSHSRRLLGAVVLGCFCAGCATVPEDAYRLPPSPQGVREAQTRTFEVPSESKVLQVAVALMQDMDYNFDTIEYQLGLLVGSKVVDADSAVKNAGLIAADIAMILLSALGGSTSAGGGAYLGADDEIKLTATLVVLPSLEQEGKYTARITIQSELFDKMDRVKKVRMIEDPVVYNQIFEKLSKSVYLEGAKQ
jgi:hypothetical protein